MALGLLPLYIGWTLQERSGLLPENSLLFKVFFCFARSDVSFVLHSMKKGDGMGGDAYCTPNIWESVSYSSCDGLTKKSQFLRRGLVVGMDRE